MPHTRDCQDYCTEQKAQTDGVYIVYVGQRRKRKPKHKFSWTAGIRDKEKRKKVGGDCGFESRSFAGIAKATKNTTSRILIVSDFDEGLTFFLPYLFGVAYIDPLTM